MSHSQKRPVRHVPKIQPHEWSAHPIFRETFLSEVEDPKEHDVLRAFGKLLYSGVLASRCSTGLNSWIDSTARDLQAALADLRQVQGFLTFAGDREKGVREDDEAEAKRHDALARLANRLSRKVGALADELDKAVGDWKFDL
ncbi:MAG TPA: hypothetical protein VKK31_16995 [Thermoanaerobaculia bacterium]|nr:hypothetical protein [Thermoanaerobaculia bacterium]